MNSRKCSYHNDIVLDIRTLKFYLRILIGLGLVSIGTSIISDSAISALANII